MGNCADIDEVSGTPLVVSPALREEASLHRPNQSNSQQIQPRRRSASNPKVHQESEALEKNLKQPPRKVTPPKGKGSSKEQSQQPQALKVEPTKPTDNKVEKLQNGGVIRPVNETNVEDKQKNMKKDLGQFKKLAKDIENLEIYKQIQNMLKQLCYTEDSEVALLSILSEAIAAYEETQTEEQKRAVTELFTESVKNKVSNFQLFFDDIKNLFIKSRPNQKIRQFNLSRIYWTILNHQQKKDTRQQNKFGIKIYYDNQQGRIKDQKKMDKFVNLQNIGEQTERLGNRVSFIFNSLKRQSEQIKGLLSNIFTKYSKDIKSLSYDFNEKQIFTIAEIARNACDYYDNGVFILFLYFVRSIKNLESKGKKVGELEKLMEDALGKITKKYPPGEGLAADQKVFEPRLKQLDMTDKFSHSPSKLTSSNKKVELEEIITDYARIASRCREHFENLVKGACLERCLSYKVGLKYYPNNPNAKAMMRIQEKMLFQGKEFKREAKSTIKEVLESEEEAYKKNLQEALESLTEVTFKISDMVRGKCIFLCVEDIIETIVQIKNFVNEQNAKGEVRYRITEIESRFTKKVPISDVTLKIAINEEIVSELQLTLQTNAAAYNFAHKVYELSRSKIFSKVKITHNYFEEYESDFCSLVKRGLQTDVSKKLDSALLENFFTLKNIRLRSLSQLLPQVLSTKLDKPISLKNSIDASAQGIMRIIFAKRMGKWYRQLGAIIKWFLDSNQELKGFTLQYFWRDFDFDKQYAQMEQFSNQLDVMYDQQDSNVSRSNYVQAYVLYWFGFQPSYKADKLGACKTNFMMRRARQIQFKGDINDRQDQSFQQNYHANDMVMGQCSEENLKYILQFLHIHVKERDLKVCIRYYKWFIDCAEKMPSMKESLLPANIKLLMAQSYLQWEKYDEAKELVSSIKGVFKQKEQFRQVLECEFFLVILDVLMDQNYNFDTFNKAYKRIIDSAKVQGVKLEGRLLTEIEWRLGEAFWERSKPMDKIRNQALDVHYRKAFTDYSSFRHAEDFIKLMFERWNEYSRYKLPEPVLQENPTVRFIRIVQKDHKVTLAKYLSLPKWPNLESLQLGWDPIGPEGCKFLSQANWPELKHIELKSVKVKDQGCKWIAQANWPKIRKLSLIYDNQIAEKGCEYLSQGKWPELQSLNLCDNNKITDQGAKWISQGKWPNLKKLNMNSYKLGDKGIEYLSKAKWPQLMKIELRKQPVKDPQKAQKRFMQDPIRIKWN